MTERSDILELPLHNFPNRLKLVCIAEWLGCLTISGVMAMALLSTAGLASDTGGRRGTALTGKMSPSLIAQFRPKPGPYHSAPSSDYLPYQPRNITGQGPVSGALESSDLAPVLSEESGLPYGAWQGLAVRDVEVHLAQLSLPSRSPALHATLLSLIKSQSPVGGNTKLAAVLAEALYRSGALDEAAARLSKRNEGKATATQLVLAARLSIAIGETETGCRAAKRAASQRSQIAKTLRGEAIVLAGYCAVLAGNASGAGLAAELARNEGYRDRFTLRALDAIGSRRRIRARLPKQLTPLGYRLLIKAGVRDISSAIATATPTLLRVIATDRSAAVGDRVAAGERAAARNVLSGAELAEIYREVSRKLGQGEAASSLAAAARRRVELFAEVETSSNLRVRARAVQALVGSARPAKMTHSVLNAVKPLVDRMQPDYNIAWFSPTAVLVMLAAKDYASRVPWLALAGSTSGRRHHNEIRFAQILADLVDPDTAGRDIDLTGLVDVVADGRMRAPALRRLTTVLDALDYNVPVPVWDAANRASDNGSGRLPPTGVLSKLQAASRDKRTVETILLAMRALGEATPRTVHLIALGDIIRALKRAGMIRDAKRVAFEAVYESWPH
ncbi:MAG: hypothetical protein ACR2PG_06865 [Hyphomicrobiaceae bacterium]